MAQARLIVVHGNVQGVGFRAWTQETAREMDVRGWVRNLPEGTVEIHAEGSGTALEALIERLRAGETAGRVDSLDIEAAEPSDPVDFEIRG